LFYGVKFPLVQYFRIGKLFVTLKIFFNFGLELRQDDDSGLAFGQDEKSGKVLKSPTPVGLFFLYQPVY